VKLLHSQNAGQAASLSWWGRLPIGSSAATAPRILLADQPEVAAGTVILPPSSAGADFADLTSFR